MKQCDQVRLTILQVQMSWAIPLCTVGLKYLRLETNINKIFTKQVDPRMYRVVNKKLQKLLAYCTIFFIFNLLCCVQVLQCKSHKIMRKKSLGVVFFISALELGQQ